MSKSKQVRNYSMSLEEIEKMQHEIYQDHKNAWTLASVGSFTAIGAIFALAALIQGA